MPLDVLVSGLIPPIDAPPEMRELRLPALEKWLARAESARDEATTSHQWLAAAFALPSPPPIAAIALAGEDRAAEGAWLRADPVHVRIDREKTSLHAAAILEIGHAEADALVDTLNRHFLADGLEFRTTSPGHWYVRVPADEVPATTPLDEAIGRDVRKLLPAARGRIKWPAALTEIQMLFASHEVNLTRERSGRPAINSVWLWGGGEVPRQVASPYTMVLSDDPFARGLAAIAGIEMAGAPRSLIRIETPRGGEWTLATSHAPQHAIHRGAASEWIDAVLALERDWFGSLGEAIARFGTVRLVLPSAAGTLVATLTAAARWRLFRRRQPLAAHG